MIQITIKNHKIIHLTIITSQLANTVYLPRFQVLHSAARTSIRATYSVNNWEQHPIKAKKDDADFRIC